MPYLGYLNSFCTIQAYATAVNATGFEVTAYGDGTCYNCRLDVMPGSLEDQEAGRTANTRRFMLFLDKGAEINTRSRVISSGATYAVTIVNDYPDRRGNIHHREIVLERVE